MPIPAPMRTVLRFILPQVVRIPLANRAYRFVAFARRVQHRKDVWLHTRITSHVEGRSPWRLPAILSRKVYWSLRQDMQSRARHRARRLWGWVGAHRHLFNEDKKHFSLREMLRYYAAFFLVSAPDLYYRRMFSRLGHTGIETPNQFQANRQGLVIAVGSLGPGGAERQAVATAIGLRKDHGSSVSVLCANLETEQSRFFLGDLRSAEIEARPVQELQEEWNQEAARAGQWITLLPQSLREVDLYCDQLTSLQPRVAHFWLDEVNIKGGIAAVLLGIPRVVLGLRSLPPYHFGFHQPYMREAYRWLAKQASVRFTCNSQAGAKAYEAWIGLPQGAIKVIYNGFDFEGLCTSKTKAQAHALRAAWSIPSSACVVGSVMRLSEEKRPWLWLEVAHRVALANPSVYFLVVGDGPLRSALEKRTAALGLSDRFFFAGTQKAAYEFMAAFDLFLLTSRAEGLPNVLIESQAVGVPVVTTSAGGAPETVAHGETGWVMESDSPAEIAHRVGLLLQDTDWCNKARQNMPSFLEARFGLAAMLNKTVALYA